MKSYNKSRKSFRAVAISWAVPLCTGKLLDSSADPLKPAAAFSGVCQEERNSCYSQLASVSKGNVA